MQAIREKDTTPEMRVRKTAHRLGYRYRLHRKDLPGKPDLVFRSRKVCIFIHGCFWHRHLGCTRTSMPKTNAEFWQIKFEKNVQRDRLVKEELERAGWRVETIWECETKKQNELEKRLIEILSEI